MNYVVVFVTASSKGEAEKIGEALIDLKLAACVNITPQIKSIFIWQGKKNVADEWLLIAKTQKAKFKEIRNTVKKMHSYDTPEIIALPIVEGDEDYLNWIEETLK